LYNTGDDHMHGTRTKSVNGTVLNALASRGGSSPKILVGALLHQPLHAYKVFVDLLPVSSQNSAFSVNKIWKFSTDSIRYSLTNTVYLIVLL